MFNMPAEFEPHDAVWLAWPSDAELWGDQLAGAQQSFLQLCEAIADVEPSTGEHRGEALEVLVRLETERPVVERQLAHLRARVHVIPYGDIWLRDTAPIFVRRAPGWASDEVSLRDELIAACFQFNGWGGKYVLPHDAEVAEQIVAASRTRASRFSFVLEGGSVDVDGLGTCLTTRQCLLNPNRNGEVTENTVEAWLHQALGVTRVLWVTEGLLNDHTDGHIDTIARFVAPGVVVCMRPSGSHTTDDPNASVLQRIESELREFEDARGEKLRVVTIPSPGRVLDASGAVMPASYVNFYIANRTVVVPTYDSPHDALAVREIAALFPTRRTIGVPCKSILTGGGAFHCISQQQPTRTPR